MVTAMTGLTVKRLVTALVVRLLREPGIPERRAGKCGSPKVNGQTVTYIMIS